MKTHAAVCVLSILLLFASTARAGRAAAFSAELLDTRGGQTTTGTFRYQDKSYRFDFGEKGRQLTIMVDGQSGMMRVLNPSEKAYYEAGPHDPMSLFANPFALYAHYAKAKEVRIEGTESVGGVSCRKQVVASGEQVFVTAWVSDECELPLKVLTQLDGRTIELRNIQRGPQDAALFAVPADYKLKVVKDEPTPQPEWAGQVASAPLLTLPFERTLPEGGILRMRPQTGKGITFQGTNVGKGQGSFTMATFKGGKLMENSSMSGLVLDPKDSGSMTQAEGLDQADEIVVRVDQGTMKIKATFAASRNAGSKAPPSAAESAPATPAAAIDPTVALNAPTSAEIAAQILVEWTGAGNPDDFISVARPEQPPGVSVNRTRVREGSPLKLWMPSDPGEYELRYVLGRGSKVLARSPITITAVPAKVDAASAVNAAAWIEVKWEGPARDGDYICVSRLDQKPGTHLGAAPVKEGNPSKVRAPSEPGDYEVRYILARNARLLAKTPVTVNPVTAEIRSPASATAGTEFEVGWQGPGYPEDFVAVAAANQPPGASVNNASVRKGNPLKLRAPTVPGPYEVRYILGRGNRLLGKTTITITAP